MASYQRELWRPLTEADIITLWMLKWSGKTDRQASRELCIPLSQVKDLIKHEDMFHCNGVPTWVPWPQWWTRYLK